MKKPVRNILGVERPKEAPTGHSMPVRIAIWPLNARKEHLLGIERQKEAPSGRSTPERSNSWALNAQEKLHMGVKRPKHVAFGRLTPGWWGGGKIRFSSQIF